ncbi:MAG TPA: PEGA domain-containing protein, partial [Polyangiaceae bacterium]|nr:PEGA domain-containing protein [Polyangiaceae bacterium]
MLALLALSVMATITSHSLALPPWPIAQTADWKTKQEARKAYAGGKAKMGKGDYAGALEDFRNADRLVPGAAPKYQIAVCLDRLGKAEEAVAAYRAFLDTPPGDKYVTEAADATKRVAELEQQLIGKVKLNITPAGAAATITVDGAPAQGPELSLKPGRHTIIVSAPGYQDAKQEIEVKAGATADVTITLAPTVGPSPTPLPDPIDDDEEEGDGQGLMIAGFVVLGVGVVAGVLTTIFGVQALNASNDFENNPTEKLADDAEKNALLSDVFLGIACGTAAIGIILIAVGATQGGDDDEEEARVKFVP